MFVIFQNTQNNFLSELPVHCLKLGISLSSFPHQGLEISVEDKVGNFKSQKSLIALRK